jgi:hypothetical protein
MNQKYPSFISFFRDIIPNDTFEIQSKSYFEFSDEQLSDLYFLWKSNSSSFFDDYKFLTSLKDSLRVKFAKDMSFQDFSAFVKLYSYDLKQSVADPTDSDPDFINTAKSSLNEKAFFLFQFESCKFLYIKVYPIIEQLYSVQGVYFFQYIYCTQETQLSSYLKSEDDFPPFFKWARTS